MKLFQYFVALGGVSLLMACGGGGSDCPYGVLACGSSGGSSSGASGGASGGGANVAPVANAGSNQTVVTGKEVTLNGTASSDANNDKLKYLWSVVSAPTGFRLSLNEAKEENATAVKPTFTPTLSGAYVFGLVVSDGHLSSPREVVTVTASPENLAPAANAGVDQSVTINTPVTLDGSASTDPNRDVLTHTWAWVSQPAGSNVTFDSATSAKPKFTPVIDGAYVVSLVVRDGSLNSAPDFVTVTVSKVNAPPVANAGPDQNVITGSTVTLNGLGSTDANGDALTYRWTLSRPSGSAAALLLTVPSQPTFVADVSGDYVASLIVNDLKADSQALSTVRVTAAVANLAPIAVAAASRSTVSLAAFTADKLVTLDGTGSTDANFDRLTYTWTLTTVPTGNTATLTVDPLNAAKSTFTPNVVGVYVATLMVSDGKVNSPASTVAITVTP
ncbi:PKD domain-containing protein [Limnohabitans sp.]|uniref:PKD domain-containing protein n=1 Tax=Limnohabitans sp. TaxID=1907725 RepID=UPI002AFFCB20|nr:PKD domain-containing protein [Limnohabitans sp.]